MDSGKSREAMLYTKKDSKSVQCNLCNRRCIISESKTGLCGVRKNTEGKLYSLVYGKSITFDVDPIEKKPLYHFIPGSRCMSISTLGCNFFCKHCQNHNISQMRNEETLNKVPFTKPEKVIEKTLNSEADGIAYTYTEPTIFAEYALDIMKLAKKNDLYNVWVSNGYMTKELAEKITPFLDAINIDLKGSEKFYSEIAGNAKMKFVKENINFFNEKKVHVEVTTLIIPGYNDDSETLKDIAEFIYGINPEIPLHFSRFTPMYKLNYLIPTPIEKLKLGRDIALKTGLKNVYVGNVNSELNTICSKCNAVLINRDGYFITFEELDSDGKCKKCGMQSNIILK